MVERHASRHILITEKGRSRMRPILLLRGAAITLCLLPIHTTAHAQAPPFAGAAKMTLADALKQAPKLDPGLAPLDKAFSAAEAKLKKSPKDPAAKKAYVEAAYKYGKAAEDNNSSKLTPPVQYRAALAMYNKALKVDPKHQPSITEKQKIVAVYKSMGRPVPGE
jgi:tetratricopeptide (TPR) repeat protein